MERVMGFEPTTPCLGSKHSTTLQNQVLLELLVFGQRSYLPSTSRIVRIGTQAQKVLWRYITLYRQGDSARLFLGRNGTALDVTGVKLMIRRLGKKAKLDNIHVHRLRHTFAISFLRAGGDVFSLQYILGHTTLSMTQRYLQSLSAEDAMKAHRRFSQLDSLGLK